MKYDFTLDMRERRSHTMILKKIAPGSAVLEMGCATGIMTKYMSGVLGCRVVVCDVDAEALKTARRYADGCWQGDLETMGWADEFAGMRFDYILCADVLEHLRDPGAVLERTAGLLKEEGSVLLSMPNIAHDSVVYGLLQNRFEYTGVGLLDRTHLRFYTYPSLIKLCLDAGYSPVEEDAVYMEAKPPTGLPNQVTRRQYGRVFQFVFELKKTSHVREKGIAVVRKIKEYPDDQRG
jgi:SAM-dependent methyltransferase